MNPGSAVDTIWRFIDDGVHDAVTNMAVDQALVLAVQSPVLRVYAWQPWAISLGYHQKSATLALDRCHADGIDVVKRPTGGRAVLHAQELTYAVVLPRTHAWYAAGVDFVYREISQALVIGLRQLGLDAAVLPHVLPHEKTYALAASCFAKGVRYEIAVGSRKIVGSAQRRFREGILQHGSILIGNAHERIVEYLLPRQAVPEPAPLRQHAISMADVLGFMPFHAEVAAAVKFGFEKSFHLTFIDSRFTQAEKSIADGLRSRIAQTQEVWQ